MRDIKRRIADTRKHPCRQSFVITIMVNDTAALQGDIPTRVPPEQLLSLLLEGPLLARQSGLDLG